MLQILDLNVLYPLAFVSLEKDVSCVSLYGFYFLITWLTKYGHEYRKWRQSLIEGTWPKDKPSILRDSKIWRLEVIRSNHFVVKGLPSNNSPKWPRIGLRSEITTEKTTRYIEVNQFRYQNIPMYAKFWIRFSPIQTFINSKHCNTTPPCGCKTRVTFRVVASWALVACVSP